MISINYHQKKHSNDSNNILIHLNTDELLINNHDFAEENGKIGWLPLVITTSSRLPHGKWPAFWIIYIFTFWWFMMLVNFTLFPFNFMASTPFPSAIPQGSQLSFQRGKAQVPFALSQQRPVLPTLVAPRSSAARRSAAAVWCCQCLGTVLQERILNISHVIYICIMHWILYIIYIYYIEFYVYTVIYILVCIYDGLSKCLLVWLVNRNSLRAASCLVFKTMTYLNSLIPCIVSYCIFHVWNRS